MALNLPSFFTPDDQNDPRVNTELRKRIALQMLNRQYQSPKTVGEGLASLGAAIGEKRMIDQLEAQDLAQQSAADRIAAPFLPGAAPTPVTRSLAPAGAPVGAPAATSVTADPTATDVATGLTDPSKVNYLDAQADLAPADRDKAVRTIVAEAADQGDIGRNAVASVMLNRLAKGGGTLGGVVTAPNQFEPWNTAAGRAKMAAYDPAGKPYIAASRALDAAYSGNDPTQGAVNFYSPGQQAKLGRLPPRWDDGTGVDIGGHRFFGGQPPAPPAPVQVADSLAGGAGNDLGPIAAVVPGARPAPPDAAARVGVQPPPDYVSPERGPPQPPPRVPPSAREIEIIRLMQANRNNPYAVQQLGDALKLEQEARAYEQGRQLEQFKSDLQMYREGVGRREGQLETAHKRRLEAEKLAQDIAKGKEPRLAEDVENKLVWNERTQQYERPKIAGADEGRPTFKPATEFQGKAFVNYGRAYPAHEGLTPEAEKILATSPGQQLLANAPFGQSIIGDKYKEAFINAENFVQAFIRQQSGASTTPYELEREARSMIPKYNDPPQVIEQKRQQREQFLSGMKSIVGPQGQRVIEYEAAQRRAAAAAKPGATQENPVRVGSEAEANKLPRGTYGVLNGRPFRVD